MFTNVRNLTVSDLQAITSENGIDVGWGAECGIYIRSIGVRVSSSSNDTLVAVKWFDTQKTTPSTLAGCKEMLAWLRREERLQHWPWRTISSIWCAAMLWLRLWRHRIEKH
jgi:hypothetical protein